jgi:predicted nucleic acid-binding protein
VACELWAGAELAANPKAERARVGALVAALRAEAPLVTRNVQHFARIPGLDVIGY